MNTVRNILICLGVAAVICATPAAKADFTFGEPVKSGVPLVGDDCVECLSYDGLEMYIDSNRSGGLGDYDLWVLKRASRDEDWGPPENLGPAVNSPQAEFGSSISVDGLTLYFCSYRVGASSTLTYDIYMTTRATKSAPWGQAVTLGPTINAPANADLDPWISPSGLELYFVSNRSGGQGFQDIWVARRVSESDPWQAPVNVGPPVNTSGREFWPSLSPDGLLLFFNDDPSAPLRPGGYGNADMWMTRRASTSSPWQAPVNLGPMVNSAINEIIPRPSSDGSTLCFITAESTGSATWDNWQAPIIPIVDFNGDGKVDGKEVLAMAQHWGENYPLCDIAPFAWGDGIVDLNDLTVLAGYIGQEVNDPTLSAHWALDETEGTTAADSAGENDGTVAGGATWQPQGKIGGALALDGVDDVVTTRPVPGLGKGAFSLMAWVQGGSPGQVVLGHSGGSKWLCLNPTDGSLATEVVNATRGTVRLVSKAVIADGQWHRIAVVWDGTHRMLYVDEKEVAKDRQTGLTISDGGLLIGAGTRAGSHWSGLIDDVRLYNRAVSP